MNFQSGHSDRKTQLPSVEIRSLAASFVFYLPIYRDLLLSIGVTDASRYDRAMFSLRMHAVGLGRVCFPRELFFRAIA